MMIAAVRPYALSLLRLVAGLLFLEHGTAKFLAFPHNPAYDRLVVASPSGIGGIIELVCGMLITFGLFTRTAAFIASGEMAVAYFMAHAPRGFFPLLNGGELAIMYCFTFLYLAAAGGGAISLDAILGRRRR